MTQTTHKIEISLKSIIYTILILLGIYFLYQIKDILLFIFIGVLVMTALSPMVAKLESFKLSRSISIVIVYVGLVLLLALCIGLIIPPLISQVISIVNQIPIPPEFANILKNITFSLQDIQIIANQLTSVPKIFSVIGSAFSGVIVFFSLLVFSFYLLQERVKLGKNLRLIYKDEKQAIKAEQFVSKIETQIGGWVRAEFTLMIMVGMLTFIGLTALRINFALSLAIVAGLLEILPNIGPTISAVPAIAVAYFAVSPLMAVAVAVLYILVQQIENNFIVPMVMRQVVGLSPIITISLLLIGFRLASVTGAALAIPIFLVGKVVAIQTYKLRNQIE
jgi:predicted PurR-regulated permease PerM